MALISAWRIEASQVFCDLFIIPKEWVMAHVCAAVGFRKNGGGALIAFHARNPKSKFRELGGGSIWSAEGDRASKRLTRRPTPHNQNWIRA
jgi:hypothetical protein